jgi:large subunit ribosomal protein L29
MKITEIRELPEHELQKRILDEEENLAHLRFQKATSQLESPIKIRTTRRLLAKMRTILREYEQKRTSTAPPTEKTTTEKIAKADKP